MGGLEFRSVAIGEYTSFEPIPADAEALRIHNLLRRLEIGADEPWPEAQRLHGTEAVMARLQNWRASEAEAGFLYWVGHGGVSSSTVGLFTASTDRETLSGSIEPSLLAQAIARRSGDEGSSRWTVILIDACRSADFVLRLRTELDRWPSARALVVGSSQPGASTKLGPFGDVLAQTLATFRTAVDLDLIRFGEELARRLDPKSEIIAKGMRGMSVRNNWAIPPGMVTPADRATVIEQVLDGLHPADRQTLVDAASGGGLAATAWYYTGREKELEAVAAWIQGDGSLLVITGAPGSGKSAFLGNLLARTNRSVWEFVTSVSQLDPLVDEAQDVEIPPFAAALRLTGATLGDALDRLSRQLGHEYPADVVETADRIGWLANATSTLGPRTVLVDGLDESLDPLAVAQGLLVPLARAGGIRFVVGTRWSTRARLGESDDGDRDLLDALNGSGVATTTVTIERDEGALIRYVSRRLGDLRVALGPRLRGDIRDLAVAIAARSTDFLFARLAVLEISELSGVIHEEQVYEVIADDHAALFDRAFERLSEHARAFGELLLALSARGGRGMPVEGGVWRAAASKLAPDDAEPATDADVDDLILLASPYLLIDDESRTTVYRLAHETFEARLKERDT